MSMLKMAVLKKLDDNIDVKEKVTEINGEGKHLFPGCYR